MPAHPHAELMALYAKDATETNEPWKLWEWFNVPANSWVLCKRNPAWMKGQKYRRKPERPWYRVALIKTSGNIHYTFTADSPRESAHDGIENYSESATESYPNFIKWLTDRVYYDAE